VVWKSTKYNYSIEIPSGFSVSESVGANVDFKANKGRNSVVIVVKSMPKEYEKYTIWDIIGDLNTFGQEWENGAKEFLPHPKFKKLGKTTVSNLPAFWYDYTTENPQLYSKTYQIKKGIILYTITLTSELTDLNYFSPIWFRFKDKIIIK
jgi:hypothetical protein